MESSRRLTGTAHSFFARACSCIRRHGGTGSVMLFIIVLSIALGPVLAQESTRSRHVPERESADFIRKRADWFFRQRASANGHVPSLLRIQAIEETARRAREERTFVERFAAGRFVQAAMNQWTPIGPQPTANTFFFGNTSGRVTALAVDPCDSTNQTVYLGAADGGVWRTTNGGASWTPLMDASTIPTLAIGSLALDTSICTIAGTGVSHANSIFAGTGEENFAFDSLYGAGVLRSSDGGQTWTRDNTFTATASGSPGANGPFIGALAVQRVSSAPAILAAAQGTSSTIHSGVWRSTDGGTTWMRVLPSGSSATPFDPATNVLFDPSDPSGNTAYAALGFPAGDLGLGSSACPNPPCNGVYISTNGGVSWSRLPNFITALAGRSAGRITLAINPGTPPSPSQIYAAVADASVINGFSQNSGPLLGVFVSNNMGASWTKLSTPDFCTPQCFYDMVVRVAPSSSGKVIFLGGAAEGASGTTTVYRSTDGGSTWLDVSATGNLRPDGAAQTLHVDHHAIAFAPNGSAVYAGNDGGVWSSTNAMNPTVSAGAQTWANLNGTLQTTQFYPGNAIHEASDQVGFAGSQDNGTQLFSGSLAWADTEACGDGGFTAIDPMTPANVYASCADLGFTPLVQKNIVGGHPPFSNWSESDAGINAADPANFIPPLAIDPNSPATLYFGTDFLYQSTTGASRWTAIAGPLAISSGAFTTAISVAPNDSNTVYVGTVEGLVLITRNAGLGFNAAFNEIDATNMPNRPVTALASDPRNTATLYATFSGFSSCGSSNGCDGLGNIFVTKNATSVTTPPWTNITGDLPDVPVNDIVVDPATPTTLYIGTDVGVFTTTSVNGSSTHWSVLAPGLPNAEVLSLKLRNASRTLRAGTHGRGAWDIILPGAPAFNLSSIAPVSVTAGSGSFTLAAAGSGFTSNSVMHFGGTALATTFNSANSLSATVPAASVVTPGTAAVQITDASNSSNTLAFSVIGTASDFSFGTPSPSTDTVAAGSSAKYTILVSPVGTSSSGVALSCSGQPQQSTCSFSPNPVTPASGGTSVTLTISTTVRSMLPFTPMRRPNPPAIPGVWPILALLVAAVLTMLALRQPSRLRQTLGLSFAALVLVFALTGCGGGVSIGPTNGTPAGTYAITITGIAGSIQHSTGVTLVVQ